MTFLVTQKPTPPTVFNLQASDLVRFEEETGTYYQLSWFIYKLVIVFLFIFKEKNSVNFMERNTLFKKFPKIYYSFFFKKEIIGHTYMCTKCNDNFKFTISLKSYE